MLWFIRFLHECLVFQQSSIFVVTGFSFHEFYFFGERFYKRRLSSKNLFMTHEEIGADPCQVVVRRLSGTMWQVALPTTVNESTFQARKQQPDEFHRFFVPSGAPGKGKILCEHNALSSSGMGTFWPEFVRVARFLSCLSADTPHCVSPKGPRL